MTIDGILNLDKPRGKTSFDMVALVRRLSGERRVGHAGTLDPEATGVLPVCLGQATRLIEYLAEATKSYRAEVELGIVTDTFDAAGKVMQRSDVSALTREKVEAAVTSFSGSIEQTPPMYSAVKHKGLPLYRFARLGMEVPRKARKVEIFRLEVIEWKHPLLTLEVECSKGTYIRSLAHDIGRKLGCGGYLRNLVRLKSGPFHISEAASIEKIEEAFRGCNWSVLVLPMDVAVRHLPAITVGAEDEKALENGRPLPSTTEGTPAERLRRVYSSNGLFIAIIRFDEERACWKPEKVFQKHGKA